MKDEEKILLLIEVAQGLTSEMHKLKKDIKDMENFLRINRGTSEAINNEIQRLSGDKT